MIEEAWIGLFLKNGRFSVGLDENIRFRYGWRRHVNALESTGRRFESMETQQGKSGPAYDPCMQSDWLFRFINQSESLIPAQRNLTILQIFFIRLSPQVFVIKGQIWAGALVQWLLEETHILKVVGANPSTVFWMDIFHIYLLQKY